MIEQDHEILKWDHTTKGAFTINKSNDIQERQDQEG